MAKDTAETRVAGTGSVYIGAYGSPLPSAYNGPVDAAFVELGYTDEDGVTFTDEPSIEKKQAWQSFYPVRIIETARMAMAAFNLEQWNSDTLALAAGGEREVDDGQGDGDEVLNADGTITDRYVIPKCIVTSSLETNLNRSDLALLPVELEAIGEDGVDPWFMFTSDTTAFA